MPTEHYPTHGLLATLFVVASAILVTLLEIAPHGPGMVAILVLGAIYLVVMLTWGDRLEKEARPRQLLAYFTVELLLTASMTLICVQHKVFSLTWLALMPLVAQARLLLRPAASFLVYLAPVVMVGGHALLLGAGWHDFLGIVVGVTTALVFVLIFTDIAARASEAQTRSERLSTELASANQKLSAYAVQAEELAAAKERSRMAREIHDSLGHYLTVVNVQLEVAQKLFDRDPEKAREALDKAQSLNQEGLKEVRRSVSSLRASPLEGRLLNAVLHELVEQSTEAGLPTHLRILGQAEQLSAKAELTLYRTVQEGLTNARKHAQASRAEVSLDYSHSDRVALRLSDNGRGIDGTPDGFGLLGVRERVRQLNGHFAIHSQPSQGFTLEVDIPR